MKKISVIVPCFNEQDNVIPMSEALVKELTSLEIYDYEIIFIDNCSTDRTRDRIRDICVKNKKIRAIFNARNFGQFNSPYHAICQSTGDCAIVICCDFQDPVELIPTLVREWESGKKIVCGTKTSSRESKLMYFLRSIYYRLIKRLSHHEFIEHFTGFGLYDRSFVDVLRRLDDPTPFLRGIVAELGYKIKTVEYEQQMRRAGRSTNSLATLYDAAMLSFTSYTRFAPRFATVLGALMCAASALGALICVVLTAFSLMIFSGVGAIILTLIFLCGLQLFFLGFIGEYILAINARVMHRPLVIEAERINFDAK